MTLIDGEMIIDTVPDSGLKRRYLAYDLMALDSVSKTKVSIVVSFRRRNIEHPSLLYYVEASLDLNMGYFCGRFYLQLYLIGAKWYLALL